METENIAMELERLLASEKEPIIKIYSGRFTAKGINRSDLKRTLQYWLSYFEENEGSDPQNFDPGTYGDRAFSSYLRPSSLPRAIPLEPDGYIYKGRKYIVLCDLHGILAVYQVRRDDRLRRIENCPTKIIKIYE